MQTLNLIPQEHQRDIRRLYRLRLLAVACFILGGAGALGALTLLPSLFSAKIKHSAIASEIALLHEENGSDMALDTGNILKELSIQIAQLSTQKNKPSIAEVYADIIEARFAGITIERMGYTLTEETKRETIELRGVAESRDLLVRFEQELEKMKEVESVAVPIANLAGSRNISFSATLILKSL